MAEIEQELGERRRAAPRSKADAKDNEGNAIEACSHRGRLRSRPSLSLFVRFRGGADIDDRPALTAPVADDAVDGACSAASKCHRLVASKPERFKEVRPGNDDGVPKFWRNWRGHDDVMQTRSIRGSGEPVWVIALL